MKKIIIPAITFIIIFSYFLFVDYQETLEIQPEGVIYPINIAGTFGYSILFFAFIYPILSIIISILSKGKKGIPND